MPGDPADLERGLEVRGVVHDDFEEQRLVVHGEVADLDRGRELVQVGFRAQPQRLVGDDGDRTFQVGGHELQCLPVHVDMGRVEFEGAPDAGKQGDHDDAPDEERGDPDAFGPFDDVGHRGVDEHDGDDAKPDSAFALFPAPGGQCHRHRGGGHQDQDACGVSAALGVDVGVEQPGDQEPHQGEHQDQRAHGPCPPGGHAVPGQVARHEVQQPGHGGGAGEPQDGNGAQVIDGAESVSQVFVREIGQGTPVRLPARLELLRRDQYHRGEACGDEERAHDQGRRRQQPACTLDPALRVLLGVRDVAADLRHHGDAGLEPGQAQGQLGEDEQRDAHHHQRAPVLGGQGQPPVVDRHRVLQDLDDRCDDHDDVQPEVNAHQDDGDADRLLETAQEHGGEQGQEDQRDRDVLALDPVGGERVLDRVRCCVRSGERHGDHEVGGGETQQHQDEQFPAPPRQQPLQHGDGPFAARTFAGHPAVHRQCAQQGHGDQDQGGQRRNHAGRERGDGGLVAQRGEVVHAGQAHDLPPRVLLQVAVAHGPGPLMDTLGVLQAEQQPFPEVVPGSRPCR
ncbi:hypothetical protein SRABI128_05059 [Microbacterium sp. Bi128]|nr:hypothetical protein SRABI128_05059 [Microbacterium sp. Bi128]